MRYLALALVLAATFSFSSNARATEIEVPPAPVVVTPPNGFTAYNTTGIQIGQYLYLYHQGSGNVPDTTCDDPTNDPSTPDQGDKIIAYRALLTNGVPGAFERVGRISPCAKSPTCVPSVHWDCTPSRWAPASYGPGQIFQATVNGHLKYHLLADVSDTLKFRNVWHAESDDGINWTWFISGIYNSSQFENATEPSDVVAHTINSVWSPAPFLEATETLGLQLLNPVLRSARPLTNNARWWGFLNFAGTGGGGVTALEIDWSTGAPQAKILTSTSPSWTYSNLAGNTLNVQPVNLHPAANVKTLHLEGQQYQLWGWVPDGQNGVNVSCNTNTTITCTNPNGCRTGDGSVVGYNQTGRPFWLNTGPPGDVPCPPSNPGCKGAGLRWWPVTPTSFGAPNPVFSQIRAMPSGYVLARMFPFRWNSPGGQRYLFSGTNDAYVCTQFLWSLFLRNYVVRTELVDM